MSDTYSNVDGSADPEDAVRWQERVDAWPQVLAYKRRVRELLGGGGPVLDVGCGPGGDLVAVGVERGFGVDPSAAMCAAAQARGVEVCRADGHALPFAPDSFAGVCADRVLQHVAEPTVVLGELRRVVRPAGRVVVADPDQETLAIHVPGVHPDLVDRVKRLRRDVGFRNGRFASSLPDRLVALGCSDVSIESFPLTLTDPDDAFGLPGWLAFWRDEGGFSDQDQADWHDGIQRGRSGGFVYTVTYFVVSGTKP